MVRKFINWFVVLVIVLDVCYAEELQTDFFFNPEAISPTELAEQLDQKSVEMCFQFPGDEVFHFISKKNEVYFDIFYNKPPLYSSSLYMEDTVLFDGEEKKIYHLFSYEKKNDDPPLVNQPRRHETIIGPHTNAYLIDQRRVFEEAAPKEITEDELASLIALKRVLFYTGAGISVAAGVPSMAEFSALIGLGKGPAYLFFLKNAMEYPENFCERIAIFYKACFCSQPTLAHRALKELAFFKNSKIVTENLDCLHECTGIMPYRIQAKQLREEVEAKQLATIEYIICIGLSYDDKGFLGWYKRNNPNGKIIAIDLGTPSYLGDEDFIIHADLQQLLPSLASKVLLNVSVCSRSSGG